MSKLDDALTALAEGEYATHSRDFGRGVAYAVGVIRQAREPARARIPLNVFLVTVESTFGEFVPHEIAATSLADLWEKLAGTDWKTWLPPEGDA